MQIPPFILLASGSPRRHEILNQLHITHGVLQVPAPAGEDEPQWPGEAADEYVQRTALEKALRARTWLTQGGQPEAVPASWPSTWRQAPILCADTTVILDGDVLGKPRDLREAAATLGRLSGRRHRVHTAVVLLWGDTQLKASSISEVDFQPLSPSEIAAYCATGEPSGKAGSYAIQGMAAAFVTRLSGSHSGVMGLPAHETYALLRQIAACMRTGTPDPH